MDWGLLDTSATENKLLREETVYSSPAFYYFAMIEDIILRLMWAISYILTENEYISSDIMT
ncbi:unnamed protein product, partial [Timema podura]|nr:unnamed protein product [Timema podura]